MNSERIRKNYLDYLYNVGYIEKEADPNDHRKYLYRPVKALDPVYERLQSVYKDPEMRLFLAKRDSAKSSMQYDGNICKYYKFPDRDTL